MAQITGKVHIVGFLASKACSLERLGNYDKVELHFEACPVLHWELGDRHERRWDRQHFLAIPMTAFPWESRKSAKRSPAGARQVLSLLCDLKKPQRRITYLITTGPSWKCASMMKSIVDRFGMECC